MNADARLKLTLAGSTAAFLGLALVFLTGTGLRPRLLTPLAAGDTNSTNTATVRMSASELVRTGGDTSGMDCYACHDKGKPVQIHYDTNQNIVLPKEHADLAMRHGRNNRNNHCFNCHDPANLDLLLTRDGNKLKITESTRLCGSCHGPTYRDWEKGVHGRTSGYWARDLGPITRADCASCHDPHAPAFPSLKPAPAPRPLRETVHETKEQLK
jgi:formate-dependent nitrite reductase cytochrome c552 subunit